jgi:trimeric autotransporter adhesin
MKFKKLLPLLICCSGFARGQNIITVAGSNTPGYSGDTGPATMAELDFPRAIAVGTGGEWYIADGSNNVIRKVSTAGIITTFAGTGLPGYAGDGAAATAAQFDNPWAVVLDKHGNMYVADAGNNVVRKIDAAGIITTVVGNGYGAGTSTGGYIGDGAPATAAELFDPIALALDTASNLYVADYQNNVVRKVNGAGIISTIAGTGTAGYSGDGAAATAAELNLPASIAFDKNNVMYFADFYNNVIRNIDTAGNIHTVIGTGYGAGTGVGWFSGDGGPATAARLAHPFGLAIDTAGNIFFSDVSSYHVREVGANDTINTIAGNSSDGYSGDGGPATAAELSYVYGVTLDTSGSLLIADAFNHVIRKIGSPAALGIASSAPKSPSFEMFPNPACTTIAITSQLPMTTISVANAVGDVLLRKVQLPSKQATIDLSTLPAGIYYLSVNDGETRKFLKE